MPDAGQYRRAVYVEKFTFNADGTIPTVVFSKAGPPQIGTLNPYDTVQAETICWSSGVRTRVCSESGMCVDSIHNGDYIKVKGVNFGSGANLFMARVASGSSGGNIELRLDTLTGPIIGTCAVTGTGGWQTWATRSCTVSGASGIHNLYLKFTGGSGTLFNFNWWKFNSATGTVPGSGWKGEARSKIHVSNCSGYIRLDFSQSAVHGELNVNLFDLKGRPVTVLFTGRL